MPGDPAAFRKSKRAQSASDDETWVDDGKANTLNNFDLGDTRTTHAVVQPQGFSIREDSSNNTFHAKPVDVSHCVTSLQPSPQSQHAQNFIVENVQHQAPGDVAPTVTSSGPPYSRTGNERVEADALAITFQPGNLRRDAGAEPSTTTVTTLKATMGDQMPHVAQVTNGDVIMENNRRDGLRIYEGTSPTLQAFMGTGGCNVPMIQPAMAVRRLTPTECLRLQGFPDDWTKIPWKGKSPEECPDGPQYKAAGNSWAVPCARYIGERINMVEEIKDELSQSQA